MPFSKPYEAGPSTNYTDSGLRSKIESNIPIPISGRKEPYTIEYFSLNETANPEAISQIEDYVMSYIEKNGLEDTPASYEQVVKELFEKLGLTDNHTGEAKFEKITKYFELLGRNKDETQKQRDLLKRQKDAEMTKEKMRKEAIEKGYMKAREERNKALNEAKAVKDRLAKAEAQHNEAIQTNRLYQQKIQELIQNQEAIMRESEAYKYMGFQQRQAMDQQNKMLQSQLKEALQREQQLSLKHNQLKSLIQ